MSKVVSFHETGIKPEEDFTGFLIRQAELTDVNNHRGLMVVMDKVAHRPAFVHPSNIEGLARLFPASLPDWESLVMNHTRYRLNSAFISESKRRALLKQYRFGTEPGAVSHVAKHNIALRGRLQLCRSCMEADRVEHGFVVWHRLHLTPSILYCPKHKEPLVTLPPTSDIGHRRWPATWHPRQQCPRGEELQALGNLTNDDSVKAAIAIAEMAQDVLDGHVDTAALAKNTGPVLRRKIRHIAQTLDRRDYHQLAHEYLNYRLGAELPPLLGFEAHTFIRVTGHPTAEGPLTNPVQNIAGIWSLFDGWQAFLNEVKSREVAPKRYDAMGFAPPKRVRKTPDNKIERWKRSFEQFSAAEMKRFRTYCRSTILSEKARNSHFTRSAIRNLADGQKLTFFATHFDQRWLDKHLPKQRGKFVPSKAMLDVTKRQAVQKRYEETIRNEPGRYLTRAYLLSETSGESIYKSGMGSPELEALLDQLVDEFDTWSERQVNFVTSLAKKIDKSSRWATREAYESRSRNAFSKRISEARQWIKKSKD
ncbi:TniQ family protein [Paraburkholderia sp. EG287A]|uniref:TniQ family protein n=1 Tax=Paraburkholderia sp. EG287A TaxID=3237012 RepID=UPI0034D1EC08